MADDPVDFETEDESQYLSILWGGRRYVPYCPMVEAYPIGECLGCYQAENGELSYVCELEGLSPEEWLADTSALENCPEGMIFKEENVTVIPEGLASEYEWN